MLVELPAVRQQGFCHFLTIHFVWLLHQKHLETICSHRKEWHQHRGSQKALPKWGVSDMFPAVWTKPQSYGEHEWQPCCLGNGFQGTGNHQQQLNTFWTCVQQLPLLDNIPLNPSLCKPAHKLKLAGSFQFTDNSEEEMSPGHLQPGRAHAKVKVYPSSEPLNWFPVFFFPRHNIKEEFLYSALY